MNHSAQLPNEWARVAAWQKDSKECHLSMRCHRGSWLQALASLKQEGMYQCDGGGKKRTGRINQKQASELLIKAKESQGLRNMKQDSRVISRLENHGGGGEPKLPLLQPRHSVWHLGVNLGLQSKVTVCLHQGRQTRDLGWWLSVAGGKVSPLLREQKTFLQRNSDGINVLCTERGNLKCKSHPLVLGLPPALLYYLKMVA